ncbi:hypothetical protein XJ32_04120 [Helicobacter bilis]|uniref:Toxin-antitoxin system YwqK family antitoxin n=1 Tax=Helicobacter bilis TaxID=37372 RepID=A0A1Q2LHF7_9HELI|nr:hypothetical protein [Helicobacter bilis]AQQ59412.1 hypothetical protein XJ32_04120 [Helicobacter bilis]
MLLKNVFIGFLSFSILHADTLKECKTEADKISGCVEKEYDSSVNLWRETPYKNGKKEGIEKRYYENGNLEGEIPYKNHNIDGDMKLYTEDKKLLAAINAQNNKLISGKCFNNKVLTDKDLKGIENNYINIEKALNYLQEICLNPFSYINN